MTVAGAVEAAAGVALTGYGMNSAAENFANFAESLGSGSAPNELKEVYNTIKESPNYPEGFQARPNGTTSNKVNNQQLLEKAFRL